MKGSRAGLMMPSVIVLIRAARPMRAGRGTEDSSNNSVVCQVEAARNPSGLLKSSPRLVPEDLKRVERRHGAWSPSMAAVRLGSQAPLFEEGKEWAFSTH